MKFLIFISLIYCTLNVINSSFINPYPRYQAKYPTDDVGEALFLTPYIEQGKIEEGQRAAKVSHPQLSSIAPSYTGYLTVNKTYNSNLFFWYIPAHSSPDDAPVVLWLQGGPGASSLFGLFTENGPYMITAKEKIAARKYSWHSNHHLIYIDNPVGTGFSFTDNDKGYSTTEVDVGLSLHEALKQFFTLFPKLQANKFYVTGESYAGKYVPSVAHTIHKHNGNSKVKINLQGIAIGNGLSDPLHQLKYGDYLYQLGLIDVRGRDLFHEYEKKGADYIKVRDFAHAFEVFDELINMDQLPSGSFFKNMTGFDTYFNYLNPKGDDSDKFLGDLLQSADVRRAIHVGNNTWHDLEGENKVEEHLKLDVMDSVAPYVSELLEHYRVCIYNGQLDIIVAYPLTLSYLQKLNFKDKEIYKKAPRYIWRVDGEIAGYAKEAGNLVEVLVRNAGHMVPHDQPQWALDLIMRLTHGKGFNNN
uniref:Carboxypeptidase n=1 Tax=Corethrella appendiculata TaxID=1370023 RepID=U5EN01_9DIPT